MNKIMESMFLLVDNCLPNENMKKPIHSFIEFKLNEGIRFGELVWFHYELFGGKSDEIIHIAAGMELLILAIDIFDDLVDQDNSDPPWMKIAPSTATHIAMALLTISQKVIDERLFDDTAKQKAKKMFSNHILRCISGQQCDAVNEIHNEYDFLANTKEKSGALLSCACLLGTIFSGNQDLIGVKEYAEHFGIAVQIANDIKDVQRENDKNDFLHKKKTLPTLYVLNNKDPKYNELRKYYEGKIQIEKMKVKQNEMIAMIRESGAIEYAKVIMQLEINKAMKIVNNMDISEDAKKSIQSMLFR